jgi:rhodanese-related sulfurtransferase
MLTWFVRSPLNAKLGLAAFLLGVGALGANVHGSRSVRLHETELATIVGREVDHVSPAELASWIIEGRSDYRLLDLRAPGAFAEYHIPTAENVPVASLPDAALARPEKLVLYSDGEIHAAQAWMLVKAKGYAGATTLLGGLEGWRDEILFPALPANATPSDRARFERAAVVARFFGGQPRSATAGDVATATVPTLPKVETPSLPAGAGPSAPRKKKKEGC